MCSFRLHQQKQDKTADRSSVLEMEKRVRVRGGGGHRQKEAGACTSHPRGHLVLSV